MQARLPLHQLIINHDESALMRIASLDARELNAKDAYGFTPLQSAARQGANQVVLCLLAKGAKPNKTTLSLAAERGHTQIVQMLIAFGAKSKLPFDSDYLSTILFWLIHNTRHESCKELIKKIKRKVNFNTLDWQEINGLMDFANHKGFTEVAEIFDRMLVKRIAIHIDDFTPDSSTLQTAWRNKNYIVLARMIDDGDNLFAMPEVGTDAKFIKFLTMNAGSDLEKSIMQSPDATVTRAAIATCSSYEAMYYSLAHKRADLHKLQSYIDKKFTRWLNDEIIDSDRVTYRMTQATHDRLPQVMTKKMIASYQKQKPVIKWHKLNDVEKEQYKAAYRSYLTKITMFEEKPPAQYIPAELRSIRVNKRDSFVSSRLNDDVNMMCVYPYFNSDELITLRQVSHHYNQQVLSFLNLKQMTFELRTLHENLSKLSKQLRLLNDFMQIFDQNIEDECQWLRRKKSLAYHLVFGLFVTVEALILLAQPWKSDAHDPSFNKGAAFPYVFLMFIATIIAAGVYVVEYTGWSRQEFYNQNKSRLQHTDLSSFPHALTTRYSSMQLQFEDDLADVGAQTHVQLAALKTNLSENKAQTQTLIQLRTGEVFLQEPSITQFSFLNERRVRVEELKEEKTQEPRYRGYQSDEVPTYSARGTKKTR